MDLSPIATVTFVTKGGMAPAWEGIVTGETSRCWPVAGTAGTASRVVSTGCSTNTGQSLAERASERSPARSSAHVPGEEQEDALADVAG